MNAPVVPSFAALVRRQAAAQPDATALTFEGAGKRPDETRSYAQLWANGQALARGLRQAGLQAGDRFGLVMANHAEFVDVMVASSILGTVFVPIDPRTKGDKLAYMLKASDCQAAIVADYALANLLEVLPQLPALRWAAVLETDEAPDALARQPSVPRFAKLSVDGAELEIAVDDGERPMQLIYTSGTTGDPKGIVMTHKRFCDTAAAASKMFGYAEGDRLYSGLSLTHANAQLVTVACAIHCGLPAVLSRRFTKSRLWDITRKYQCTTFTLLGGMTNAVYAEPVKSNDGDNPVRFVVSAGMPATIWEKFEQRFNLKVLEFYGAAEGGLTFKPIGVGPVGSIGKPVPSLQYRIVDEDGKDCPPGTPGELLFRHADGKPFKVEYHGQPEASAKKCKDGWLHMGDVVVEDKDGWLYFQYRKGGGIRRNGDFILPAYVEKVIAETGLVDDVYVYGVPAQSGAPGEKDVVAAVVPKSGNGFAAPELFKVCRRDLEANLVPTYIQVLDQIPKTASEKPQDRFLIEAFERNRNSVYTEN